MGEISCAKCLHVRTAHTGINDPGCALCECPSFVVPPNPVVKRIAGGGLGVEEDDVAVGLAGVLVDARHAGVRCTVVKVDRLKDGTVRRIDVLRESDGATVPMWRRPAPGTAAFLVEDDETPKRWVDRPNGLGEHTLQLGDLAAGFIRCGFLSFGAEST